MARATRTVIPVEVFMRLDDVAFPVPDTFEQCTPEQKARVIEEAAYLVEMLAGSYAANWYDDDSPLQRGRMRAQTRRFLARVKGQG